MTDETHAALEIFCGADERRRIVFPPFRENSPESRAERRELAQKAAKELAMLVALLEPASDKEIVQ